MPIFFLVGEEETLASDWLSKNLSTWVPEAWRPFSFHKLDFSTISNQELANLLQSLPMGSDYRVAVIKEIGEIGKLDAAKRKQYAALFQELPLSTIAVFWLVPEVTDVKKISLGKEWEGILKFAEIVKCSFKKDEKQEWVRGQIASRGLKMSKEAEAVLLEVTGGDMHRIALELDKLSQVKEAITIEMMHDMLAGEAEASVFAFLDRLGERSGKRALKALQTLLEQGEAPLRLLAAITNQFRLWWQIMALKADGKAAQEIAKTIGVHPFRVTKGLNHTRNFSLQEMPRFFDWLARADYSLKTGRQVPEHLLQLVVARICKV